MSRSRRLETAHGAVRPGYDPHMGRSEDQAAQQAPAVEAGGDSPHGMGVSSEHDQGEVQEVDSRERDE